jgi:hypothetical protein
MPAAGYDGPNKRDVPPDFMAHARKSLKEICAIYGCGDRTARRWRVMCGVYKQNSRKQPFPANIAELCAQYSLREVARQIRWNGDTLRARLKLEYPELHAMASANGHLRRAEAGRAASQAMNRPRQPVPKAMRRPPIKLPRLGITANNDQVQPVKKADKAMRWLQRFGPCYPRRVILPALDDYSFKGCIMTADEIIAEAERRGWEPDAWRKVAA